MGLDVPKRFSLCFSQIYWCVVFVIGSIYVWLTVDASFTRIQFPYDLLSWPESAFLTNLVKLNLGYPVYMSPDFANSFPYAPGFEYLYDGIRRLFDAQINVLWPRLLSWLLQLFGVLLITASAVMGRREFAERRRSRTAFIGFCILFLVTHRSEVSDVPHPDSLLLFVCGTAIFLAVSAIYRQSVYLGIASIAAASFSVWTKQSGMLCVVGIVGCFLFLSNFRRNDKVLLSIFAILVTAVQLAIFFSDHWRVFYTVHVLSGHSVVLGKIVPGLLLCFQKGFYRYFLYIIVLQHFIYYFRLFHADHDESFRVSLRHVIIIFVMVVASFGPTFIGYLKEDGANNNLIISVDVPIIVTLIASISVLGRRVQTRSLIFERALALAFVVSLLPIKSFPTQAFITQSDALRAAIEQDIQQGKSVLLSSSIMLNAPFSEKDLPRDRAYSIHELRYEGVNGETLDRIASGLYQTIYVDVVGPANSRHSLYTSEINRVIDEKYVETARFPASEQASGVLETRRYKPMVDWLVAGLGGDTVLARALIRGLNSPFAYEWGQHWLRLERRTSKPLI